MKPRDILTYESFENAVTVVCAMGGSTNAILHLPAIAYEAGVRFDIDVFARISRRTPLIVNMRPSGRYVMVDLDRVGGVPAVLKNLLEASLLHGDTLTVTGKTLAENLKESKTPDKSEVIRPLSNPIKPTGGIAILKGNVAPEGSVIKVSGSRVPTSEEPRRFSTLRKRPTAHYSGDRSSSSWNQSYTTRKLPVTLEESLNKHLKNFSTKNTTQR